ncbi:MAG: hypothetical protein WDO24_04705 [Pseudomonadota bacterium]
MAPTAAPTPLLLVAIATPPTSARMVALSDAPTDTELPVTDAPFSTLASMALSTPLTEMLAPTAAPVPAPAPPTAADEILPSSSPAFWVD